MTNDFNEHASEAAKQEAHKAMIREWMYHTFGLPTKDHKPAETPQAAKDTPPATPVF